MATAFAGFKEKEENLIFFHYLLLMLTDVTDLVCVFLEHFHFGHFYYSFYCGFISVNVISNFALLVCRTIMW